MDSLTLFVGGNAFDDMRFDVNGHAYNKNNKQVSNKVEDVSAKDRDFTTSPRVGLTFDVTNEAMLYAAHSETFAPKSRRPVRQIGFN